MPKVSVIIPTYQSVRFVRETIESVLTQTYWDYEVIAVDGGSTDGTIEVLNSYSNRIQVIIQNGKGISNARNIGVLASKGEYIAFVDSDDLWLPHKLEVQVKFLESRPNIIGLIYSDALFFVERDKDKPKYKMRARSFQTRKPHRGRILEHLIKGNFIPASTVMIRKSCFEKVGLYDESLWACEDIDMWIRIAECFEIDYHDMVLVKIRWHEDSMTHHKELLFSSQIALENKIAKRMSHLLKEFNSADFYKPYLRLGILHLLKDETENAKQRFRQYLQLYPHNIRAYILLLLALFPFRLSSKLELNRYIPRKLAQRVYQSLAFLLV